MATVNPYLVFDGKCEEAFTFYKSVFGGEFPFIGKYKDMPPTEGAPPLQEADKEKIMHVSLPISKETILMGSDHCEGSGQTTNTGNNFSISINADSQEEADKLFVGLSTGGKITLAMNKTFWGAYFGMLVDKFDIHWMVNFNQNQGK
ncbi:MAG: VOC family protein [Ferruginibacter sp.]